MQLVDNREYVLQLNYGEQTLFLAKYWGNVPSWSQNLDEAQRFSFLDALEAGDQLVMDNKPMSVVSLKMASRGGQGNVKE